MSELQRTAEWAQARLGHVTASRISDVCARTKTGYGASRATYRTELLLERLKGVAAPRYVSQPMQYGIDNERKAIAAYNYYENKRVQDVGFVLHPRIPASGASPDGLVDDDGLVEVKVPNSSTHFDYLLGDSIPLAYVQQMQFQMACTGRAWCHWVSFDPDQIAGLQYLCHYVKRDDIMIAAIEKEVMKFQDELDEKMHALRSMYGIVPKLEFAA